ncbi:MAG TPA: calcium-binding protein, partial [Allosphingosinicella sp.]|nr:calcium-binding protein [Allosphingosinicella sp.]
ADAAENVAHLFLGAEIEMGIGGYLGVDIDVVDESFDWGFGTGPLTFGINERITPGDGFTLSFPFGSMTFSMPGPANSSGGFDRKAGEFGGTAITASALSDPFLTGSVDISAILAELIGLLPPPISAAQYLFEEHEVTLIDVAVVSAGLSFQAIDLAINGAVALKETVTVDPRVTVTARSSFGETVTGISGEKLEFTTPEGEGTFTANLTYRSQAVVTTVISAYFNATFDAAFMELKLWARNPFPDIPNVEERFAAYDYSTGLFGIDIPIRTVTQVFNMPGSASDRVEIAYEKFRSVQGSGDNFTFTTHQIFAIGNNRANALTGNRFDNRIVGNGGNDRLVGLIGDDVLTGGTGVDVLAGGAGNDSLSFGDGNERFGGEAGNDTVDGGGGDDLITDRIGANILAGGAGDDRLTTGAGDDSLDGGGGDDVIVGGSGDNRVDGGGGHDRIATLDGADDIKGGAGNDVILAAAGTNVVDGGAGNDEIATEGGADHILGGADDDVIQAGNGRNVIDGGGGDDRITAGGGGDDVKGGLGGDVIAVGAGANIVDGGGGNDIIGAGGGGDRIFGGAGDDAITAGDGANRVEGGDGNDRITAGAAADIVAGGAGNDRIETFAGADRIDGHGGDDVLVGGAGIDVIVGGAGRDVIDSGAGDELLIGDVRPGSDEFFGLFPDPAGAHGDTFVFRRGSGRDTILDFNMRQFPGEPGSFADTNEDRIDLSDFGLYRSFADLQSANALREVTVNGQRAYRFAPNASDVLLIHAGLLNLFDDSCFIFWTHGKDLFRGTDGADLLDGGADADRLVGGAGDDTYRVDDVGDVIVDGAGQGDDVALVYGDFVLNAGAHVETIEALYETQAVAITGNELANRITGNEASNVLSGGGGDDVIHGGNVTLQQLALPDTLNGGSGDDRLEGGWVGDRFDGGTGTDTVVFGAAASVDMTDAAANTGEASGDSYASIERFVFGAGHDQAAGDAGANRFEGNAGQDILNGRGGADTLIGGDDYDRLIGGDGNDLMTGGGGDGGGGGGFLGDDFEFAAPARGGSVDRITDFVSGQDRIVLRGPDALSLGFSSDGVAAAFEIDAVADGDGLKVTVNFDADAEVELTILLIGAAAIAPTDFLLLDRLDGI